VRLDYPPKKLTLQNSLQSGLERPHAENPILAEELTYRAGTSRIGSWPAPRWALPVPIILFGFALRILYINHESVSGDEAFSMSVSQLPLQQMMRTLVQDFVHPPLHYFVLCGWFKLFGYSLFQARMLSVVFGTLAILFTFLLAEYLLESRTALLSALLLTVSQLGIMFSQEVRPYAQFHFLALCSSYLFLRTLREGRPVYWWGFVGSAILMLYTDYFSLYLIAALLILPVLYGQHCKLRLWWVLTGGALTFALYLPWMASGILRAAANSGKTFLGTASYAAVHWYTFFSIVNSFNNGKPTGLRMDSPWWTYVVGGLFFSAPLLLLLKNLVVTQAVGETTESLDREGIVTASVLWLVPILLTMGIGRILHIPYNVRYVSFCAALYYILVARAVFELPFHWLRWCLVALILVYSANSLRANYFMRWKEYWTEAFTYVEQNRHEGDCGVFLPDFAVPPQWPITQADRPSFRVIPRYSLTSGLSECQRVWEVSWAPRDDFRWLREHEAKNTLLTTAYRKMVEQHYYGVRVALYSRKEP
jgi:4-amino-4-deoxy-L-arabinose transferase-like glycosyltransferase